ncbi:quinone oxidoreductase [soil metagenome]
MPHAIMVEQHGGPEVLRWKEVPMPAPGAGMVRIRHTAIGVNFVDAYNRSGLYKPAGGLPYIPGAEAAGVVDAVGADVTDLKLGDRVVYQGGTGAYAQHGLMAANRLIRIPDGIDERTAAAAFLKGVTVEYLLLRTFKVQKGHTILFHAAAGGVGMIACQWAKALGATVIGTVGSDEKAKLAKQAGCDHVINYRTENFVERVKAVTNGGLCEVVYDSVGKDTFPGSLDCLKPLGMWVSFGQSSGVPPPFQMSLLQQKGSLFATRPTTAHYFAKRADLEVAAANLFAVLKSGAVRITIGQEFALKDAAEAHRAMEGRQTTGATILIP